MVADVRITVDDRAVRRYLASVERGVAKTATLRAINDTARRAHTESVREVAKRMGVVQKRVRKDLTLSRATRARLVAVITAKGRPLPLIGFRARQLRRGVKARAWGQQRLYPHTFIATMPSGHRGVFVRVGRGRLPIRELWGPAVPKEFEALLSGALERKYRERFLRELVRQVTLLERRARRGSP